MFSSLKSQSQHGFHFVCSNVVSFPESQTAQPDLAAKCRYIPFPWSIWVYKMGPPNYYFRGNLSLVIPINQPWFFIGLNLGFSFPYLISMEFPGSLNG